MKNMMIVVVFIVLSSGFLCADTTPDVVPEESGVPPQLLVVVYNNNLDARFKVYLGNTCLMNQIVQSYGFGARELKYDPMVGDYSISLYHTFYGETTSWSAVRKLTGKKYAVVLSRVLYSLVDAKWLANVIVYENDEYHKVLEFIRYYEENLRMKQN